MKQAKQRRNKPLHLLPRAPGYLECATRFSDSHYRTLASVLEAFDREQSLLEQANPDPQPEPATEKLR